LRSEGKSGIDSGRRKLLRKMTPMATIRRGHAVDLPAVATLLKDSGLPTADLASAREFQSWLLEEEGSILGVIGLERFGHEALLRSLAVAPERRKRGLGHELVARLEQEARADGIAHLVLLTETAQAFFRRLGYAVTDRSQVSEAIKQSAEFRLLCPVSAICMSKALSHG
jgi:N-acetylglutamate synthase-like GNAT family acetyltransferase